MPEGRNISAEITGTDFKYNRYLVEFILNLHLLVSKINMLSSNVTYKHIFIDVMMYFVSAAFHKNTLNHLERGQQLKVKNFPIRMNRGRLMDCISLSMMVSTLFKADGMFTCLLDCYEKLPLLLPSICL